MMDLFEGLEANGTSLSKYSGISRSIAKPPSASLRDSAYNVSSRAVEQVTRSTFNTLFDTLFESGTGSQTVSIKDRPLQPLYQTHAVREEDSSDELLQKNLSDRVTLLARKYAAKDKFSKDESARLAIVTEKLRKLLPPVRPEEISYLEQFTSLLEGAKRKRLIVSERLKTGYSQ
jgi:hypothetical protein